MRHSSVKLQTPIEFINIKPFNPLISKCEIKVCWVGDTPNRNRSVITKDVARTLANSLPGSPIVGFYKEDIKDFDEHTRELVVKDGKITLKDVTRPYGFVDLGARVWFQKFLDDGQIEREYLMTEGWLWTGQYEEAKRIMTEGNNHSMELDKDIIDAYWTKDDNGKPQFFIINEAIISKLCILGNEEEPCFEGSTITKPQVLFSFEEDFKEQLFSMMNEIKQILIEGGETVNNEVKDIETEVEEVIEPIVEPEGEIVEETSEVIPTDPASAEFVKEDDDDEKKEEVCPKCGKPISECECEDEEEDDKKKYSLEEIPEYVELATSFANLQKEFDTLKATKEELELSIATLSEFKKSVEKKEKEAMIESFYMLNAEDKKDVIENIDSYSLEQIEAKLAIICVRNKVNFSVEEDLDENKNQNPAPTSYNLNDDGEDDLTPAWIRAMDRVANKN